ncbi:serine hydrolase domain-containing protein [Elizabethkingia meningoseptica]|uniref:serine hydrolase domain-containing protein n=1 Tax=Elizabethkingia meningoseptica TaxID=238 RepID=UPI0023AE7D49|nr:serine hydrolase domain-containing protein [Elizabethkingia meningoseptica]MDE5492640.1 beta-lactamase family protein [Elizabethkingia meningoseptica]
MKNSLFIISLMCLCQFAAAQQNYKALNAKVDSFVIKQMKDLEIPGIAVAIIKDGKVIKKSVYGTANIEWKNKVTEHTNFQIASCTKLLTSTLLLKSIYNKKIDLEEPLTKYLDSIPDEWKNIKIKNLISHSSGIPDFYDSNSYVPMEQIVKQLKTKPLMFAPGTKEQYGQSDFMLLTYILEKIYKKPSIQILKDEVLLPLHMTDGSYDMENKLEERFMQTELIKEKATTYYNYKGKLVSYKFLYPQYTYSAGGYFASIHDMINWATGLDKGTLFPVGFANGLIYQSDKIGDHNAEFSKVGWALAKDGSILYGGHSGGPGLGDIWRFPEQKITIITLSNDGELLPRFSRAIASWYVPGLSPQFKIEKFDR